MILINPQKKPNRYNTKEHNAEKENPGTKLMFGFNHRYHPGVLKAKAIVDSGRMGKVIALRGLYGKSGGKNFSKSWRNDLETSGGGILLDQGIHMLDLFNIFLGGFTSVKSFLSNRSDYYLVNIEQESSENASNQQKYIKTIQENQTRVVCRRMGHYVAGQAIGLCTIPFERRSGVL